jgi:hypothetical protein
VFEEIPFEELRAANINPHTVRDDSAVVPLTACRRRCLSCRQIAHIGVGQTVARLGQINPAHHCHQFKLAGRLGFEPQARGRKVCARYQSVDAYWSQLEGAITGERIKALKAEEYLSSSKGWELGIGPMVVVVEEGLARSLSTTTLKDDAHAFIFGQQGLMAGVSIEGTKVSKRKPK